MRRQGGMHEPTRTQLCLSGKRQNFGQSGAGTVHPALDGPEVGAAVWAASPQAPSTGTAATQ